MHGFRDLQLREINRGRPSAKTQKKAGFFRTRTVGKYMEKKVIPTPNI